MLNNSVTVIYYNKSVNVRGYKSAKENNDTGR